MYPDSESAEFLATEIVVDPPEHALEALRLSAGRRAIRCARVIKRHEREPVELCISWFSADLAETAPGLLQPERLRGGASKYIAEVAGVRTTYARDRVAARLATDEEAQHLGLTQPAAVLVYQLTEYDSTDSPVQFDESTYPPGRWAFRQEYPIT
jgi:GntR family transcriptional regulator